MRGPDDGEQPGIFIVPAAGGAPDARARGGLEPALRRDRHAPLLPGAPRRSDGAAPASPPATPSRSSTRAPRTPSSWCRRRTAGGSRSRSAGAPTSPRCRRAAVRSRSGRPRKAFPVARVSRDSGWNLHWSDADTIHWTLGADLYTRDLAKTFAFARDGAEKPDEPEAAGVAIGFEQASDTPAGTIALVGARIVPMNAEPGRGVIERGTIVVERNRIVADRAGGIGQRAGRGAPHRRRRQDDHPRPDRRPRPRPRRERAASWPRRPGRWPPTSPTA